MDETDVAMAVAEYLADEGHTFFVDSGYGSDRIYQLPELYDTCGLNTTITIGRRVPDFIGFTPRKEVFAIEAKGEESLRKGVGQAAHYRQGVHKSYLAASAESIAEFSDTALSCGLGVIPAGEAGVSSTEVKQPVENVGATNLSRTQHALTVRTSRFETASTSFPSTTRPENALLPMLAIKEEEASDVAVEQVETNIRESPQSLNRTIHAMGLAKTLGLIEYVGDDRVRSTEEGDMGYLLLRGIVGSSAQRSLSVGEDADGDVGVRIYRRINEIKKKRDKLYTISPELAAYLRAQYLAVPDVRVLAQVLSSFETTKAELSRVLAAVALESPDAFLNLFCGQAKDSAFRELVENADLSVENEEFRQQLLELASPDSLYNFMYQIWHVGLLGPGTEPVHQNDELTIGEYYLAWERTTGELSERL